jgi:glycosyltransferase involved in cell wall biosynthesis
VKLSVVMAVRNGEAYVAEAIESVLSQSIADFEFLIVDDASTDTTRDILSRYERRDSRVCLLFNSTCSGPYPSVNSALRRARGEIIARHDADDISPPDRFAIQLSAFAESDDTSLVTGAVETFTNNSEHTRVDRPPEWQPRLEWDLLFSNVIGAGAHVMFPRLYLRAPILYSEARRYSEDYGLWCRLCRVGRVASPASAVYRYRRHNSSISSQRRAEQDECFSQIRHEYQMTYLGRTLSRDSSQSLSMFWKHDGSGLLRHDAAEITSLAERLRAIFLDYIAERYGAQNRLRLERDLAELFDQRLAYWMFRAIRALDYDACREWFAIAAHRQSTSSVARKTAEQALEALRRRMQWFAPGRHQWDRQTPRMLA